LLGASGARVAPQLIVKAHQLRKPHSPWLLVLIAACAAAGCKSTRALDPAVAEARGLAAAPKWELGNEGRGPAKVDPAFTAAVREYAAQLDRLGRVDDPEVDMGVRRSLRLLAGAIDRVPGAPRDGAGALAANVVRSAEARMALGSPQQEPDRRAVVEALRATAATLDDLARGPYRDDPIIARRATTLVDFVKRLDDPQRLRIHREEVVAALGRTGLVLVEMHRAAKNGLVK
jgi:hypothetical protein